ncbi:transcriptional regulator [Trabulsiella odontotermitis]|nr:transcriptional regulator [Trabulsiella odontotermitis]
MPVMQMAGIVVGLPDMPQLNKPLIEFDTLNQHLHAYGTPFVVAEGESILPADKQANQYTIIILQGCASLTRKHNDVLLGFAQAPCVIGLAAGVMPNQTDYQIATEMQCSGYYLPAAQALELLEKHHLWREAFHWMTWQHRVLEMRDNQLVGSNSYNQIRASLLTMAKWDESLRLRVGVMNYIQRRTRISRSVIAEVLAALRQGEYIRMHKGKLLSINRLPLDY